MSEEQKRKTWIMFKKADQSIPFESNIIPKFSTTTVTDKHGTWTTTYSRTGSTYASWKAFDHDVNTYFGSYASQYNNFTDYTTLILPEGIAICPEIIVQMVHNANSSSTTPYAIYVTGLNYETGKWDTLTESHAIPYKTGTSIGKSYITYTDTVLTVGQYYTQFRFYIKKTGSLSAESRLYIKEYQITKGRIKKI